MTVEERVALVTGANRGMGFETCRWLGRTGHRIVLTARDEQSAIHAAQELRDECIDVLPLALDVATPASSVAAAAEVERRYGRLDVLVNNAGAFFEPTDQSAMQTTSVFTVSHAALLASLETNALGALHVSQAMIPLMRARGYGRVVNVSSTMGSLRSMQRGWPAYRLSKAALNAVTTLFAAELAGTNIKVNSACPGWVRTRMGGAAAARSIGEGIETTLWLATLPDSGPTGGFFQNRRPVPW
jgi:NAD(P)-dependent dehydrogenase (short-subunit alcohol dehydrogenase family)